MKYDSKQKIIEQQIKLEQIYIAVYLQQNLNKRTKKKKHHTNEFLKKSNQIKGENRAILSQMQALDYQEKKNQEKTSNMSIVQSDALGMTIVDDDFNGQSQTQIEPLTAEQWVFILDKGNLEGHSFQRIYFSFLKGIPNFLRYKIWLFFSTQNSLKNFKLSAKINPQEIVAEFQKQAKHQQGQNGFTLQHLTNELFIQLSLMQPLQEEKIQIQKDIHRSYSLKKEYIYTAPLLRKILYALSNSGIQYSQGMNYILLNIIIYCLQSIGIKNANLFEAVNVQIEKNIFLIMREIVIRMETVFGNNNIFKVMNQLEQKIAQTVPQVLYLIYKVGMDCFSMFSQHYFSLLSYNESTPELNQLMMDLFFVVGEKAIHAIIVKMLEVSKDKILTSKSPQDLNQFLKKELFMLYAPILSRQRKQAKKLDDFGLSFYENRSLKN